MTTSSARLLGGLAQVRGGEVRDSGRHAGVVAAEVLRAHQVDVLFTLSGGHVFPLYDGCVRLEIPIVDVRHEQTATFAAEGYAKVSRRTGVASLTAGPGVTNGVSAVTTAHFTGSPISVIGGRAPLARWGSGSLQELDQVPILAPITKRAATCNDPNEIGNELDESLRVAGSPHRGPTFLDVPMDVFFAPANEAPTAIGPPTLRGSEPDGDALSNIGRLLAAAQKPVVIAGADVYYDSADAALLRLVEAMHIPTVMNGLGRGVVASDHRLAVSRARSYVLKEADLVVVVGTPLDFRLGFGDFGNAQVVHLTDAPERVAAHVQLAGGAGGDLTAVLDGVLRATTASLGARRPDPAWSQTVQGIEQQLRAEETPSLEAMGASVSPLNVYGELRKRLDRDAVVIGDGGDFVSYAGRLVDAYQPGCFLDPGPYGCLGTGPGYALGAHFGGAADRQLVMLLGDGAAGFTLGDLDTLVRFRVPVVIVLGNNSCWGLEKHPMLRMYGYHVAAELGHETAYDQVMVALGGQGETVRDPRDMGPALDRAFKTVHETGLPTLVNVITDPENAYPRRSNLG